MCWCCECRWKSSTHTNTHTHTPCVERRTPAQQRWTSWPASEY